MHLDPAMLQHLHHGCVIPAHPLALNEDRTLDEKRQRLLTRYYIAAGAGGVAIGVHTTQFEIRKPEFNLLEPVLRITAEEIDKAKLDRPFLKIAGILGTIDQAIQEAELALRYGYHMGLLSMGGLNQYTEKEILQRTEEVAKIIPVFGFYLQPSVGGRIFSYAFWQSFAKIDNVLAIKIAAFNRYQTLDVIRAVCNSGRSEEIALYTGNDDNIVADLLTPYRFNVDGNIIEKRFVGGLLGQWAVGTHRAVKLLEEIRQNIKHRDQPMEILLSKGVALTDFNAAIFDVANQFKGCIPGIHEILRRQGILNGTWCLNPGEILSHGQQAEIDRVCRAYPELSDDAFVQTFLQNKRNN